MAYDDGLAERLQDYFEGRSDVEIKKMFGGLCFIITNHMRCGIVEDSLMARVGLEKFKWLNSLSLTWPAISHLAQKKA